MIKDYINRISHYKDNYYASGYMITGDGSGDFEERSDTTTEECLEAYIKDCEGQIQIAKELLEKMRSGK